ncbi:MAG: hypothetical protein ABH830_03310 [Patescibacteria group bacterium]
MYRFKLKLIFLFFILLTLSLSHAHAQTILELSESQICGNALFCEPPDAKLIIPFIIKYLTLGLMIVFPAYLILDGILVRKKNKNDNKKLKETKKKIKKAVIAFGILLTLYIIEIIVTKLLPFNI